MHLRPLKILARYPVSITIVLLLVIGTLCAPTALVHNLAVVFTDDPWPIWLQRVWLSMFIAGPFTNILFYDLLVALSLFTWIFFYSETRISRLQMVALAVIGNFIGSYIPKLLHGVNAKLIVVDASHGFSQRDSGISAAALCLGSYVAVRERNIKAMVAIVILFAGLTINQPETVWFHLPAMLIGASLALFGRKVK